MRALSDREALGRIIGQRLETSMAELARDWRWSSSKVKRRLANWSSAGYIEVKPGLSGRTVIAVPEPVGDVPAVATVPEPVASTPARRQGQAIVAPPEPEPVAAITPKPIAVPEPEA